ncbi:MarR family winged helix-turn-helix transcriptional regulator [Aneurinibacillus aneurinilyticus]|uniref:MarR family winged helix-turn-helix transcriptional regulator n=1 Tax=Aneurinibacillus aneurinilyticus TaxID=1391 RepID=UPI0035236B54
MSVNHTSTAQKLLKSFIQFKKAEWHKRSIMGYKPSEIKVLFCIRKEKKPDCTEMKVSEISKLLHVTSPTVTQLIKSLEADGLVERKPDLTDRRVVWIALTEKGEEVTRKAEAALLDSFNGLIEYLGEEQSNQLADLLTKVFVYFNEKDVNTRSMKWNEDDKV